MEEHQFKMKLLNLTFIIFIHPVLSYHTYRAAVLEHHPIIGNTPELTVLKNLDSYRYYATQAKAQNADIIVFPEFGLTTIFVHENLTQYAISLDHNNTVVEKLRSIARDNQIYVVVNMIEEAQEYYNTNLIFDREGRIIFKYRKTHPIGEPGVSPGAVDQNLKFSTDFGVVFGIFTCFDILWENPAGRVLEYGDVNDIVYPSAWSASMPFLIPLSVQHGYSVANGVNFLASSYNDPSNALSGSGIYLADGQISEIWISDGANSTLLVRDVPKILKRENRSKCGTNIKPYQVSGNIMSQNGVDELYLFEDHTNRTLYKYERLNLSQNSFHEICDEEFCCTFDISVDVQKPQSSDIYKLIHYNHLYTIEENTYHFCICSILLCEDDDIESCGKRLNSSVKFEKIVIRGKMEKIGWMQFQPMTVNFGLQPIADIGYCVDREEANLVVEVATTRPLEDVLVFGIRGILMSSSSVSTVAILLTIISLIVNNIMS